MTGSDKMLSVMMVPLWKVRWHCISPHYECPLCSWQSGSLERKFLSFTESVNVVVFASQVGSLRSASIHEVGDTRLDLSTYKPQKVQKQQQHGWPGIPYLCRMLDGTYCHSWMEPQVFGGLLGCSLVYSHVGESRLNRADQEALWNVGLWWEGLLWYDGKNYLRCR